MKQDRIIGNWVFKHLRGACWIGEYGGEFQGYFSEACIDRAVALNP